LAPLRTTSDRFWLVKCVPRAALSGLRRSP